MAPGGPAHPPEDRDRILTGMNEVIHSGGHFWSGEYRYRRQTESTPTLHDRAYVIHDATGKPVGCWCMMDITERKTLREGTGQGARRSPGIRPCQVRVPGQHQPRSPHPLNGIVGMTVLLQDTRLAEDQQEYVETIKGSSETLLRSSTTSSTSRKSRPASCTSKAWTSTCAPRWKARSNCWRIARSTNTSSWCR